MVKAWRFGREEITQLSSRAVFVLFIICSLWYGSAMLGAMNLRHAWDSIPQEVLSGFRSEYAARAVINSVVVLLAVVGVVIESLILRIIVLLATPLPYLTVTRSALASLIAYVPWVVFIHVLVWAQVQAAWVSSTVISVFFVSVHAVGYWALTLVKDAVRFRSLVALVLVGAISFVFAIPQFV